MSEWEQARVVFGEAARRGDDQAVYAAVYPALKAGLNLADMQRILAREGASVTVRCAVRELCAAHGEVV